MARLAAGRSALAAFLLVVTGALLPAPAQASHKPHLYCYSESGSGRQYMMDIYGYGATCAAVNMQDRTRADVDAAIDRAVRVDWCTAGTIPGDQGFAYVLLRDETPSVAACSGLAGTQSVGRTTWMAIAYPNGDPYAATTPGGGGEQPPPEPPPTGDCPAMPAAYVGTDPGIAEQRNARREAVTTCMATTSRLDRDYVAPAPQTLSGLGGDALGWTRLGILVALGIGATLVTLNATRTVVAMWGRG